jgi:hypothetical protein
MVANDRSAEEDAIRKLLDRQMMGWGAGDPEAYASVFTADGDCVSFLGSHYMGHDAIATSYEVPRLHRDDHLSGPNQLRRRLRYSPMRRATIMLDFAYRNARSRVSDLAATLSDDQLQPPVPATPGWTVHELLAHLVGGAADAANRRLDGTPRRGTSASLG